MINMKELSLLILLCVVMFSCNRTPDCDDCQASIYFGDHTFDYQEIDVQEGSNGTTFSLKFYIFDDFGVLREQLNIGGMPKKEGTFKVVSIFDGIPRCESCALGSYYTLVGDGHELGNSYKPDSTFTNVIEILDWNPDEGYVSGNIDCTLVQPPNGLYPEPDTIIVTAELFKIAYPG